MEALPCLPPPCNLLWLMGYYGMGHEPVGIISRFGVKNVLSRGRAVVSWKMNFPKKPRTYSGCFPSEARSASGWHGIRLHKG